MITFLFMMLVFKNMKFYRLFNGFIKTFRSNRFMKVICSLIVESFHGIFYF